MWVPSQRMTLVFRSRSSVPLQLPLDTSSEYQVVSDEIEHLLLFKFGRYELELEIVPAKKVVSDRRTKYHLQDYIEPLGSWSLLTGERLLAGSDELAFPAGDAAAAPRFDQDEDLDWIDFGDLDQADDRPSQ